MTYVPEDTGEDKRKESRGSLEGLEGRTKMTVIFLAMDILDDSGDLQIFEQDEFWISDEIAWPLDLMDREAILGLVGFLFINADYFHIRVVQKIAAELLLRSVAGQTDPELPVVKAANFIVNTEPVEWLNSTPLVQKLTKLLDQKDH